MEKTRFYGLLEKRKNLTATIFEEEEMIELSKQLSAEELSKIDQMLLTTSINQRHSGIMELLNKIDNIISK